MFTACFDAGGKEDVHPCITVSGFVAPANAWIEFDEKWKARLHQDRLTYFHMVDFAHSNNEFSVGWKGNEPRRRKLLDDLMVIIKSNVSRKFSVSIGSGSLEQHISQELKEHYLLTGFVVAARVCAGKVRSWAARERIGTPIRFVFEDGDKGKGKLIERFEYDGFGTPDFQYKRDTTIKGIFHPAFTPLHAADWLAYEMFQVSKRRTIDREWAWYEFDKIHGTPGFLTEKDLDDYDIKLSATRDHAKWWNSLVKNQKKL
jgi:hypothetical protein